MKDLTDEELIEQNERNEFMLQTIENILNKLSEGDPGYIKACESKQKFMDIRAKIYSEAEQRSIQDQLKLS